LLLIGFSQSAGDAREFAARHRYRVDINQESVAQGMSNVGSGLVQGIPVSTSLSASSLNDTAGAKTPVASLTTGVLVILTLLFLAPLFSYLPKAVLAAIIIDAVVFGMMNVKEMRRLRRVARVDFWIAMAAILGVLTAGVLAGVLIGIVLSIVWLVYVSAAPYMPVLGRKPGTQVFQSIDEYPDSETYPGLLVLRFDSGLFFASSDALEDRLRELALGADPPLHTVVLDFEGVNFIDSQGANQVAELVERVPYYGAELRLTRVKVQVMEVLRRDGVIDRLGESQVYGNVYEAAADQIPDTST
jgi:MFS superfamily sulfate permease-like transporter